MKRLSKYYILPAIALVLLGAVLGVQMESYLSDDDAYKYLKKLEQAFIIINRKYVEPVPSKQMAASGIEGMLNELDPHSSYIPAEEVKALRQSYQGSFGGIGIMFEMVRDTARVITPIAGGPSERLGIQSGDRIVQIEDSTAVGLSSTGIQKRLKGPIGSDVEMTVLRPSTENTIEFTIEREKIPLYSINSSYMVDATTGYIKIDRFAMTTHKEFMEKMQALRDQGMERLLLDLRGNPGGIMRSAVEIADEMLGAGMTIVATRGREDSMDRRYRASPGGAIEDMPVIALVNEGSASASEILAGALQDHDRALLVGQRTFGKALVQKQFELSDGSLLQMTVGRYYTPVGRLIQTPYNDGDMKDYYKEKFASYDEATFHPAEYRESIPDSLAYTTDHGRTVFGGGGILPDVVVQPDTASLERFVASTSLDFAFVREWFPENELALRETWGERETAFLNTYEVPAPVLNDFWTFAKENGLKLTADSSKADASEGVFLASKVEVSEAYVSARLKGYIGRQLFGSHLTYRIFNKVNPTFQKAITLWPRAEKLSTYHTAAAMPQR
ncbi:S41 family peptidase [Salisaeta longa]|uniref:S41 family peptidase n=1 Tax=Salisaeta longa TaxID=503170 RepID=UPI0003B3383F|nr:S41 family peptidase [Salisaeta longa]